MTPGAPIRRIGLVGRDSTDAVRGTVEALAAVVRERGLELELEAGLPAPEGMTCPSLRQVPDVDLLVTLGGDGTLLRGARMVLGANGSDGPGIPVLGVNLGHLGFLTALAAEEAASGLEAVLDGRAIYDDRFTLRGTVYDPEGRERATVQALNDLVLHKGGVARVVRLEMAVGPEGDLDSIGSFSGDGVILSTPTGSTAYALSAGGPVITPDCPVLQLTPIAPHSLASRALVFSDREPVTVFPATPERLMMVVDGSAGCYIWPEDRILIRRSDHPVRFVRLADHEFFGVLRNKLGWGLPHVAKPGNGELL